MCTLNRMDFPSMTFAEFKGAGKNQSDNLQYQMLEGISKGKPLKNVGNYSLIRHSDTVAFYDNGDEIVMAIRGTRPRIMSDVGTAISTIYNGLRDTDLYKKDEALLRQIRNEYPGRV